METNEINIMSAIILSGILAGEESSNDERTLKRAADLTYKLIEVLNERRVEKPLSGVI